jgi:hypothetical protein
MTMMASAKTMALMAAWRRAIGTRAVSAAEVLAYDDVGLQQAIRACIGKVEPRTRRFGMWLRGRVGAQDSDGYRLFSEHVKRVKCRYVFSVERAEDAPTAEELLQQAEELSNKRANEIDAIDMRKALGRKKFLREVEKVQKEREELAAEFADVDEQAPDGYVPIGERMLTAQAKAASRDRFAAEIKCPAENIQACLALFRHPYYHIVPGAECGGVEGRHYVLAQDEKRAGEIAAKLHKLVCTPKHRGMVRPVRLGDTPAQQRRREERAKLARVAERTKLPANAPTSDCPTAESAQLLALGYMPVPAKPTGPLRAIRQRSGNWDI